MTQKLQELLLQTDSLLTYNAYLNNISETDRKKIKHEEVFPQFMQLTSPLYATNNDLDLDLVPNDFKNYLNLNTSFYKNFDANLSVSDKNDLEKLLNQDSLSKDPSQLEKYLPLFEKLDVSRANAMLETFGNLETYQTHLENGLNSLVQIYSQEIEGIAKNSKNYALAKTNLDMISNSLNLYGNIMMAYAKDVFAAIEDKSEYKKAA